MLSAPTRNQILSLFKEIGIETNYPAIILLYKVICSIIRCCPSLDLTSISGFVASKSFNNALSRYSVSCITTFFRDSENLSQIRNLCLALQSNNLHINYAGFFLSLAPGMVGNWSFFQNLEVPSTTIIDTLLRLHQKATHLIGTPNIFECNPYMFAEIIRKEFPQATDAFIEAFWNATVRIECSPPDYNYSRVDKAIKIYAANGKSKDALLDNYLLEFRDVDQHPICFQALSPSDQAKINPTKHLDESKVNYHVVGKYLALASPTAVLDRLYYQDYSDPVIECTLLINQLLARIQGATKPLIVNPSPQFLSLLAENAAQSPEFTIIVPSRQIALAFSTQFNNWNFMSAEDWLPATGPENSQSDPLKADLVLLACPTGSSKRPCLAHLMRCFAPMPNCEFIVYAPERLCFGNRSSFLPDLKKKVMQLNQIIQVPQTVISSGSKRKLICIANSCMPEEAQRNVDIPIYQCLTESSGSWVSIAPEPKWCSLTSMWKNHSIDKILKQRKSITETRNQASLLRWSQEIVIAYSIYPEDTENLESGFRARVFIQRLDQVGMELNQRLNGIPKKSSSEVYLRARTKEELLEKIRNAPFHQKVYEAILQDVVRVYNHRPEELTIKTTWLCLHSQLLRTKYNDALAKELFCGPDQSISNLLFSASFDDFASAFWSILGTDHIPIKYWTLLRQIAELAIKHGFFQENPLDQHAYIIEAQGRQKVYDITDSIRKWCFSSVEMDRMINPLILADKGSTEAVRPYISSSHTLLKLFATFSLATKPELVALDHCDIIKLPNGGIQALITKFVNDKGQIIEYDSSTRDRRKRRKVAFPPFVATCYHERVDWLKNKTKISDIRTTPIPIFLEKEDTRNLLSPKNRCSLKLATKLYRELVNSAEAPEYQLTLLEGTEAKVIDLGLPRKTENLFRNQIIITGSRYGLEDGELSYNAGTMPETTIDAHYIGFDAPQNQIATSAKLHRLSARYYGRIKNRKFVATRQSQLISEQQYQLSLKPSFDRRMCVLLELTPSVPTHTPEYRIILKTNFGHKVTVTSISQEVHND